MADDDIDVLGGNASAQLRTIIERAERLEEDKSAVMDDLKELFAEAKGNGYNTKVLKQIIRVRKQDKAERQEEQALFDLYATAIGLDLV
jgi:uncharacterized protein (UPF0335 family)